MKTLSLIFAEDLGIAFFATSLGWVLRNYSPYNGFPSQIIEYKLLIIINNSLTLSLIDWPKSTPLLFYRKSSI